MAEDNPDALNTLRPSRKRTPPRSTQAAATHTAPTDVAKRPDGWSMPANVTQRFLHVAHTYYFPDGTPAFEDRGRKLTTTSENPEVIRTLVAIAGARGWTDITVTGTERFRSQAWHEAKLTGLEVRGHKPTNREKAQLARALVTNGRRDASRSAEPARTPAADVVTGRLVKHGPAAYRHDPKQQPSYYVTIETPDGDRTLWGKDLRRALKESVTNVQPGDDIALRASRREPVTISTHEGKKTTHRNHWLVEKRSFFEQRSEVAAALRNRHIEPKRAAQARPELISEYLKMRGAELIAEKHLGNPADRRRFIDLVRERLASALERGDTPPKVQLRQHRRPEREPHAKDRGGPDYARG